MEAFRKILIRSLPRPPKRLVPKSSPWKSHHGFLVYEVNGTMYKVHECEEDPDLMLKVLMAYRKERRKQEDDRSREK